MIGGFTEDWTSDIVLDSELTTTPQSGLYFNSGTHPSITINNLLSFLPFKETDFSEWDSGVSYGSYETTRKKSNIVKYDDVLYQSLVDLNEGNQPDESPSSWLATNLDSLKLKTLVYQVTDMVLADLKLTKRLINNQFLYNRWEDGSPQPNYPLQGDFSAWVFEPKGSDYVTITLNQISFQKAGTTPVNLYILNQGVLIDTKTITPSNGIVDFKDFNYSFKGYGQWKFVIDSTTVSGRPSFVDTNKYDGFTCYTQSGVGSDVESAKWSYSNTGNGIGWNVSVHLSPELYVENNIGLLGNFIRAAFEYRVMEIFLANPNNRSNRTELIQMDSQRLLLELKDLSAFTVAKRYSDEKKLALQSIQKTFDTQLHKPQSSGITIKRKTL